MDRATAPHSAPVEALPVNKPVQQHQGYAARIRALAPNHDPRHIEAFMRDGHSTLDGLSAAAFAKEVAFSVECVNAAGRDLSERIALSHGL